MQANDEELMRRKLWHRKCVNWFELNIEKWNSAMEIWMFGLSVFPVKNEWLNFTFKKNISKHFFLVVAINNARLRNWKLYSVLYHWHSDWSAIFFSFNLKLLLYIRARLSYVSTTEKEIFCFFCRMKINLPNILIHQFKMFHWHRIIKPWIFWWNSIHRQTVLCAPFTQQYHESEFFLLFFFVV